MRRILLFLLLLPLTWALQFSFTVYPPEALPGDTLRLHVTATGYATSLEYRLRWPNETDWIEVGDISEAGSFVVYVSVPEEISAGLHFVEIELRYYEGGEHRHTVFSVPYRIAEEPVELDISGKLFPGRKSYLRVHVYTPRALKDVEVSLLPSLDPIKRVKSIEGNASFTFSLYPTCTDGVQEVNVWLKGILDEPLLVEKKLTVPCFYSPLFSVEANLPPEVNRGKVHVLLSFRNETDLPLRFHYTVTSNVEIGGETSGLLFLDGRKVYTLPLLISTGDEDTVNLSVRVSGDVNGVFSFSSRVIRVPDVRVYLKDIKEGVAVIEVANRGYGDAENMTVEVDGRSFFLGTLTGGDYDSVDVPAEGNTLFVKVRYLFEGKEYTRNFELPLPKKRGSLPVLPLLLVIVVAVAWWLRHARSRSSRDEGA